jgi:hypothetical protein
LVDIPHYHDYPVLPYDAGGYGLHDGQARLPGFN